MAIVHEQRRDGRLYQIRTAGNSVRLYTNGVFHSQYNPHHTSTGSIWDLLVLPAFLEPTRLKSILVLGIGGGAIMQMLNRIVPGARITGVEIDPVHVELGERFFGLAETGSDLFVADARQWVKDYSGPGFDFIIDDLFDESNGEPRRAVPMDSHWFNALRRLQRGPGLIAANFAELKEFRHSAFKVDRNHLPSGFTFRHRNLENLVACLGCDSFPIVDLENAASEYLGAATLAKISIRKLTPKSR